RIRSDQDGGPAPARAGDDPAVDQACRRERQELAAVATGLYQLRLHQPKGARLPAGLAGTVRAVRLLLRPATAGPGSPGRAGSLAGAPLPPRWLCLQRHDTA